MVDADDKPSGRHHEEAVPPPRVVGIEEKEGGLEGRKHHHARNDAHEEAVVGHGEGTRGEERQGKRSHLGKEDKDGGEDTPRPEAAASDEVGEGPVGMPVGQQQKHGPTWTWPRLTLPPFLHDTAS